MADLPPRFREKSFRRYETSIAKALERYPQPTQLLSQPFGLSLCTIANRLRDAMASHKTYHWSSTLVPWEKFLLHFEKNNFMVSEKADFVEVTFRDAPKALTLEEPAMFRLGVQGVSKRVDVPEAYLEAVAFLAQAGALNRPVFCTASAERVAQLESSFDVATEVQPDGSYKLI